ncbi:type I restriction enzyme endonuclease domain-containing protein [Nostoc punctiforme UO1]|uniref:type I restriction enzyme endonuclease domain-containing protein n=1 Tax=Nostoc punctiforme TaxID=272131 RepID=UPI0030B17060
MKLIIVRDMLLTGFDAPFLHSIYIDKQAFALCSCSDDAIAFGISRFIPSHEVTKRGENLGLSEDELAFYDVLDLTDTSVQVLGDAIARDRVDTVRRNLTRQLDTKRKR